jgi:hypothetical protein
LFNSLDALHHKLVINSPFDFKPSSWLKVARITFFVGFLRLPNLNVHKGQTGRLLPVLAARRLREPLTL